MITVAAHAVLVVVDVVGHLVPQAINHRQSLAPLVSHEADRTLADDAVEHLEVLVLRLQSASVISE